MDTLMFHSSVSKLNQPEGSMRLWPTLTEPAETSSNLPILSSSMPLPNFHPRALFEDTMTELNPHDRLLSQDSHGDADKESGLSLKLTSLGGPTSNQVNADSTSFTSVPKEPTSQTLVSSQVAPQPSVEHPLFTSEQPEMQSYFPPPQPYPPSECFPPGYPKLESCSQPYPWSPQFACMYYDPNHFRYDFPPPHQLCVTGSEADSFEMDPHCRSQHLSPASAPSFYDPTTSGRMMSFGGPSPGGLPCPSSTISNRSLGFARGLQSEPVLSERQCAPPAPNNLLLPAPRKKSRAGRKPLSGVFGICRQDSRWIVSYRDDYNRPRHRYFFFQNEEHQWRQLADAKRFLLKVIKSGRKLNPRDGEGLEDFAKNYESDGNSEILGIERASSWGRDPFPASFSEASSRHTSMLSEAPLKDTFKFGSLWKPLHHSSSRQYEKPQRFRDNKKFQPPPLDFRWENYLAPHQLESGPNGFKRPRIGSYGNQGCQNRDETYPSQYDPSQVYYELDAETALEQQSHLRLVNSASAFESSHGQTGSSSCSPKVETPFGQSLPNGPPYKPVEGNQSQDTLPPESCSQSPLSHESVYSYPPSSSHLDSSPSLLHPYCASAACSPLYSPTTPLIVPPFAPSDDSQNSSKDLNPCIPDPTSFSRSNYASTSSPSLGNPQAQLFHPACYLTPDKAPSGLVSFSGHSDSAVTLSTQESTHFSSKPCSSHSSSWTLTTPGLEIVENKLQALNGYVLVAQRGCQPYYKFVARAHLATASPFRIQPGSYSSETDPSPCVPLVDAGSPASSLISFDD